MKRVAKSHK